MSTKPSSPLHSPVRDSLNTARPPAWTNHRRSQSYGTRSPAYHSPRPKSFRSSVISNAEKISRRVMKTVGKMSILQRVLAALALVALATLGILFLVFNEKIFSWLEPLAERWKNTTGGWMILWTITFMTAFPPMIGYSTCGTTAGFVYGVGEGWLIIASASVAGSFCSILLSRTILRKYVERMVANDKRFTALALTLKHDGLKLLCMIRLCPLPYSLSNGAMSTFPTVHPGMYALATAIVTPKLLIHAFIGSRLAAIARSGEQMSAGARAVNWISIVVGGMVGAFTGWYIYQKTMARAKELEEEEIANIQDSIRRTGVPPTIFSDDPEAQVAVDTLAQDQQDEIDYFDEDLGVGDASYRDDQIDDDSVFGDGDGEDEEAIGLQKQSR